MTRDMVTFLRENYREDVAIVVLLDSGFFDEKLLSVFETLGIGYICSGKIYSDLQACADSLDESDWAVYTKGKEGWAYSEIIDKRASWFQSRRAIFCRFVPDDPQQVFDAFRPLTILYTNLGRGKELDQRLRSLGRQDLLEPEGILECAHRRGCDELVHRALKNFAFEELPFKRFPPNTAFYYTMLLSFFLYECFKEDTCDEIVFQGTYATTLRRKVIDLAAKIVSSGGRITIKFSQAAWNALVLSGVWRKCTNPPQITLF
jgi:hypothetical protein